MAVAVFVEAEDGQVKKSCLGAVSYAASLDNQEVVAVVVGELPGDGKDSPGKYGADKIIHIPYNELKAADAHAYASCIEAAVRQAGCSMFVAVKSSLVDSFASRVAMKFQAGMASNVTSLPESGDAFVVRCSVYTGKAYARIALDTDNKVLVLSKSAAIPKEFNKEASLETLEPDVQANESVEVKSVDKADTDVLLTEADIIVSGGRGLKGPENWSMLEELASSLGAATACSKPVADMEWRPHHEHVGQTGVKVSPQVYIAVGISGAIQHLAGVNSSRYIVVINKDPEAPFFREADYGIVGDAFEVVPKLTEAVKRLNG